MLILLTSLISIIKCGSILRPTGVTPIWNSVANADVQAQYIFSYVLETYLASYSQIEVQFPLQYLSGLGTTQSELVCIPSCVVSGRSVIFTYSEEMKNGTIYTASVQPIRNPATQGGTANFILRSKRGDNVIDENLIFGIIGIADAINTMVFGEVVVNPTGSFYAGDYTQYILKFKTTTTIIYNSYMLFTVPTDFELEPFPVCSAYPINGIQLDGTLFCSQVNQTNVVKIEGITGQVIGLQDYALKISMRNPKYAGTTKTFNLGIYKANTQMMFEEVKGISGVTIQAAQLQNVSMTQVQNFINSRSRIMDYEVRFTPTFPIPAGCNIKLIFPVYMQIVQPGDYNQAGQFQMNYVKYGLEDISEDSPIGFFYQDSIQNYLRITNFQEMTMNNEICVVVRVINPSVEGYTTPLKLYVFQDITEYQLLQSDVLYAIADVATVSAGNQNVPTTNTNNWFLKPRTGFFPNYQDYSITNNYANGALATLTLNIDPSATVPKFAFVYITVPNEFKVNNDTITGVNAANCKFYLQQNSPTLNGFVSPTNSLSCTATDQVIKAKLPFAFDVIQYPSQALPAAPLRNQWQIQLTNAFYTPSLNGTYFFDVTIKDTDDLTVLDSFSYPVQINANLLTGSIVNSIPKNSKEKAIVDIQFITVLQIPSGQKQNRASDTRGFLEFHFSNAWAQDLGSGVSNGGSIPCYGVNALIPYEGSELKCILFHSTATSKTIVRVSNFRYISTNTNVRIMISGVTNPTAASYDIDIKVFQKKNRIFTLLNQQLTVTSTLNAAPATITCTTAPSYSENRVGYLFDISISPCLTTAISANFYILIQLPKYDIGFIRDQNTITCSLTSQLYCIPLLGSDFILIVTSASVPLSPTPVFKISNLQWPRYVEDFSTYTLNFLIINNVGLGVVQKYQFNTLTNCVPSQFSAIQSLVSNKGKGFVDATYSFTFTPQADIPEGSTIIVEFPPFYDFLNGIHLPTFQQSGLLDLSDTNKVSIQINLKLIKITGFKQFNKSNQFQVIAVSVKNSQSYNTASGFHVYVLFNGKYVLQQLNFYSFDFTTPFKAGKIVINQITASILNADEEVDYLIQFTPQNDIPIGGQIKVMFPDENYKKLPSIPDCRVSGGINTFQSCILNGKTFIIETNSRYKAGNGVIDLVIKGVQNPDQGTTQGFVISTEYDGVKLDGTDESNLNGRTFTAASKTNPIILNSLVFDPKNEGEEASYRFIFLPYSQLSISTQIEFKFPNQFDPLLGRDIQCIVNSGLSGGSYTCSVDSRIVTLKGYDAYTPEISNPIDITIFGIVNPNSNGGSTTDFLKLYIRQQGSNIYDQSNKEIAQLSFLAAPGWSPLISIDVSTYNVRWNSTYNFTFQTYKNIPKVQSKGSVLIDYPSQFEIIDGSITCSSTTLFAATLKCSSYRNRITSSGNYEDYVGRMYIQLKKVLNPIEKGESDFFYIRTYDGLNLRIIERNFANLDPFKFSYEFPGPLIKVNNEKTVTIERGTQAINIPITIEFPCLLNLKLIPSENEFIVNPSSIPLTLGMTLQHFNISVPQSIYDGTYTIYWTLDNELDPPLYTPVKRTLIQITKKQGVKITQTPILSIPIQGQSLLTEYILAAPPDTELTFSLYLQRTYFAIQLSKTAITVAAGQQKFGFAVEYNKSVNVDGPQVERGYITIQTEGVNKNIYKLPSTSVEFFIISQDTKPPSWVTCKIDNIKKTSVNLLVALNEPCVVYYLIALKGTVFPSLGDFQNQIIRYSSTQSQMGYLIAYTADLQYQIPLSKLIAETEYVIHILALDRGNNQAEKRSIEFKTLDRPVSCYFTLIFNQRTVSDDFIRNVTESVAKILGIDQYYIQLQQYYFNRLLQNSFGITVDEIKSYIDLELAAIPDSDSFPDPYDVVAGLQNKTQLLTSRIETLNLSKEVTAQKFTRYVPRFIKQPKLVYIDYQQCAIQLAISNYGWGFAVAVVFESQDQTWPSPYQIMKGLDYQNRPTPNGQIEISDPYQDFILRIHGLESETDYYIYVIGGSVHFRAPDLMDKSEIYQDRIISFRSPQKPKLNINFGDLIMMSILIFWL
ncbi:unnamed protein product [Paramecium primaurelia]|uniref:Uncharacterized protein n=1 Tax=Paramecium primaurelia TaxID=5886 RepID=A0A8S1NYF8_PARPR|nr:unnamed protein product [Paramecium primaurelia]